GELAAMLQRVEDRDRPLDREERDQQQRERERAADRLDQQDEARRGGEHGGDERPPEPGRAARPHRRDEPDHSADQEDPAEDDGDRERREWRQQDREHAENEEDDSFDQEEGRMLADGTGDGGLDLVWVDGLLRRHLGFRLW